MTSADASNPSLPTTTGTLWAHAAQTTLAALGMALWGLILAFVTSVLALRLLRR